MTERETLNPPDMPVEELVPRPREGGRCPTCGVYIFGGYVGESCFTCDVRAYFARGGARL